MVIIRVGDKFRVVSPTGGTIGTVATIEEAKRLQQRALFGRRNEYAGKTEIAEGAGSSEAIE